MHLSSQLPLSISLSCIVFPVVDAVEGFQSCSTSCFYLCTVYICIVLRVFLTTIFLPLLLSSRRDTRQWNICSQLLFLTSCYRSVLCNLQRILLCSSIYMLWCDSDDRKVKNITFAISGGGTNWGSGSGDGRWQVQNGNLMPSILAAVDDDSTLEWPT
jgi:hypothetical protein